MCRAPGCFGYLADHPFRERDDLRRALVRSPVGHPVPPGTQIHHRLDVQHRDVGVVRKALVHLAHRLGVRTIVGRAVIGGAGIARCECVDQGLLARRGGALQRLGLLHELERVRFVVGLHERVDVGPEHQRLTPVGHREIGAQTGGLTEGPACFRMVEGVRKVEALVDEALRAGASGADRKRVRPEVLQPWRDLAIRPGLRGRTARLVVLVGARCRGRGCLGEDRRTVQDRGRQGCGANDSRVHGDMPPSTPVFSASRVRP